MKCVDCRGKGRFYRAEVIGDPGITCDTCSGSGQVSFDVVATDGFIAGRATFYAALYPALREAAHGVGYALALHGSLTKDLDVVAVPWTDSAAPTGELVKAVCEAAGGFTHPDGPKVQPHGRMTWTIFLGSTGGYVDLSVMPRRLEPSVDP